MKKFIYFLAFIFLFLPVISWSSLCPPGELSCDNWRPPEEIDSDNDNFTPNQGDCDDTNEAIGPNAVEICGNVIDDNCNNLIDDGCLPEDGSQPAEQSTITNLAAAVIRQTSIDLGWTAVGSAGYDIRYSQNEITDDAWASCVTLTGEPVPLAAGNAQTYTVIGLSPAINYYFALKTLDSSGVELSLSNIISATTLSVDQDSPDNLGDADDATLPAPVTNFKATADYGKIILSWKNPSLAASPDYVRTLIIKSAIDYPKNALDGELIYAGIAESFIDAGALNNTLYYYAAITVDHKPNYSQRVLISATPLFYPQDGDVVQDPGGGTIYLINGGQRSPFGSSEIYNSYGLSQSDINQVPGDILDKFGLGAGIDQLGAEEILKQLDPDKDELNNFDELRAGTEPDNWDTDYDSYSDGEEVKAGYDPLNPPKISPVDQALVNRLRGFILLQVQRHGEAWYLNPADNLRYYLRNGEVAYKVMRFLSLGITNADLAKIPMAGSGAAGNRELVNRLKGQILLQVESRGEAWYLNPADGLRYYLQDGQAAYQIMRNLSLGITNANLGKIPIGSLRGKIR